MIRLGDIADIESTSESRVLRLQIPCRQQVTTAQDKSVKSVVYNSGLRMCIYNGGSSSIAVCMQCKFSVHLFDIAIFIMEAKRRNNQWRGSIKAV